MEEERGRKVLRSREQRPNGQTRTTESTRPPGTIGISTFIQSRHGCDVVLGLGLAPFPPHLSSFLRMSHASGLARVRPRTRQASHAFRESPFAWKRRHKPIFHIGDTLFRWAACIKEDLNVVECPTMAERCRDRDGLRTVPSLRHGTLIWLTPVAHSLISRVWRPTSIISPSGVCVLI